MKIKELIFEDFELDQNCINKDTIVNYVSVENNSNWISVGYDFDSSLYLVEYYLNNERVRFSIYSNIEIKSEGINSKIKKYLVLATGKHSDTCISTLIFCCKRIDTGDIFLFENKEENFENDIYKFIKMSRNKLDIE